MDSSISKQGIGRPKRAGVRQRARGPGGFRIWASGLAVLGCSFVAPTVASAQSCAQLREIAESPQIIEHWRSLRQEAQRSEKVLDGLDAGKKDVNIDFGILEDAERVASGTSAFMTAKGALFTKVLAAAGASPPGLIVTGGLIALRQLIGKRGGLTQIMSETWAIRLRTRSREQIASMRRAADDLFNLQVAAKRQMNAHNCR